MCAMGIGRGILDVPAFLSSLLREGLFKFDLYMYVYNENSIPVDLLVLHNTLKNSDHDVDFNNVHVSSVSIAIEVLHIYCFLKRAREQEL